MFSACRDGYYGQSCFRACPATCKSCKPTDGTCSCYAGWMGPDCTIGICLSFEFFPISYKITMTQRLCQRTVCVSKK